MPEMPLGPPLVAAFGAILTPCGIGGVIVQIVRPDPGGWFGSLFVLAAGLVMLIGGWVTYRATWDLPMRPDWMRKR